MNRAATYSVNPEIQQILIQTMNGSMGVYPDKRSEIGNPVIGRILSPDKYVQSHVYTQSYNRYSYCFNNPMRFMDPGGWYVMLSNGHKVGMDFNDWGVSNSADLYMPGSGSGYQYNESSGDYTLNGEVVSYWQVHNDYIVPNSTRIYNSDNSSNNIYAVNVQFTGTSANPFSNLRGFRMSDGSFLSINSAYSPNINNAQSFKRVNDEQGFSFLETINTTSTWTGITADIMHNILATTSVGANIAYKLSNIKLFVSSANSVPIIGGIATGVNIVSGVILSLVGQQSWTATMLDGSVGLAAFRIAARLGGWYGVAFEVNYETGKFYLETISEHPEYTPYPYRGFNH